MLEIIPGNLLANEPEFDHELGERTDPKLLLQKEPKKVLVVDDEKLIADTLAEILKRHGFAAIASYAGKRALQVAKRLQPDYLLADVLMPFMNGVELAIAVRQTSPKTRILLFSGHANSSELILEARRAGHIFDIVAKPIHPEKLIQILREKR